MPRTLFFSWLFLPLAVVTTNCDAPQAEPRVTSIPDEDWDRRQVALPTTDSLATGSTYLSSYSQVYVRSQGMKFSLTGTISLRNINLTDTVYLTRGAYYGTVGTELRNYFDQPIYLAPMETVEIIITEEDIAGGTGDNFVFDWSVPAGAHAPFFEGVFISVYGQQGISFVTNGVRIK